MSGLSKPGGRFVPLDERGMVVEVRHFEVGGKGDETLVYKDEKEEGDKGGQGMKEAGGTDRLLRVGRLGFRGAQGFEALCPCHRHGSGVYRT